MTTNMNDTADLFDFDGASAYSGAEVKESFAAPVTMPATISTQPAMQGPSHQYDLYKQQTGLVPGAFESLTAANAMGYNPLQYPNSDLFGATLNPSEIGFEDFSSYDSMPAPEPAPPVRFYPGMHQAAALEKAQRNKENNMMKSLSPENIHSSPSSSTSSTVSKFNLVMPTMSARPSMDAGVMSMGSSLGSKPKKDEEDMDEDERLLASEEGKKLSSKERRQLRNKVSARAFRSRRKEYITQLEAEISNKVTENNELRTNNQALAEENRRLNDFTRMLLSSPAFSTFLNDMSAADPNAMAQMNGIPAMVAPVPTTRPMPIDISSRIPAVPFN